MLLLVFLRLPQMFLLFPLIFFSVSFDFNFNYGLELCFRSKNLKIICKKQPPLISNYVNQKFRIENIPASFGHSFFTLF